jgi:hypothetical protein
MPLQATSGAASYDAFGGGVPVVPAYIEEVFSTYLWTGDGTTSRTITNGIDLAGKGGLVFIKNRSSGTDSWGWFDTARGVINGLSSNSTAAQLTYTGLASTSATGFVTSAGSADYYGQNTTSTNVASWTFRKQPKFFDVVTWSGNGVNGRNISHGLGSVPGCIIVKRTDTTSDWTVYHRSLGTVNDPYSYTLFLNTTAAQNASSAWNDSAPTSTTFQVSSGAALNASGGTYVAYLFAHNAGGFGLTGTDNVISCGSYSGSGAAGNAQTLGYEPQWVLIKRTDTADDWHLFDNMRGIATGGNDAILYPNGSFAEYTAGNRIALTATGFTFEGSNLNQSGGTFIYIAIRRGPMKVPTSGNEVFYSAAFNDANTSFSTGFVTDFAVNKVTYYNPDQQTYTVGSNFLTPRLTNTQGMPTNGTNTESNGYVAGWDIQDGYKWANSSGYDIFGWAFKRAPSFADVVCYTGTGSATTQTHNLGVAPELIFVKKRASTAGNWSVYNQFNGATQYLTLNATNSVGTNSGYWNNTSPTASVFSIGTSSEVNGSGSTYVAYLFATCAGVSKVGSYTGTGTTQTIDCGFAGSARFILIKRTNAASSWFVYDSSRGIQAGNDPYLTWNTDVVPVTNTNFVDTASTGFQVIGTGVNVNGGTYIFLAIA